MMRGIFKVALGALAVLGVAGAAVAAWAARGWDARLAARYEVTVPPLAVDTTTTARARGEHVASAIGGCAHCHGADLGGSRFIDEPSLGEVWAPNLTRGKGGVGARLDDAALLRAVLFAVGEGGRPLLLMPSRDYRSLSAADLAALSAYVRSVPPVDREIPPSRMTLFAKVLAAAGKLPVFEAEVLAKQPPRALAAHTPSARGPELGRYLASICVGCHREDLAGGPMAGAPPDAPPPTNLTGLAAAGWTEADLVRVFREGKGRDGRALHPFMPWKPMGGMTDDELGSLWDHLSSLPQRPTGT